MKKLVVLMVNLTISMAANAIDVHGINQQDANKIIKKYGKEITDIELALQQEMVNAHDDGRFFNAGEKRIQRRLAILKNITQEKGYLFVDIQTAFYPNKNAPYLTIEIIDKEHPERMRFVNDMPMHRKQQAPHQPDLITDMLTYFRTGMHLVMQHKLDSTYSTCPVYHCTAEFQHPQLKPYLAKFNEGSIKEKKLILDTLNHDKDPDRRTGAAFLVGHFRDPHEIITVLLPHINDKDDSVRNGAMRVIVATMSKARITDVDVAPFLNALDSPYITDRNKALLVLEKTLDVPSSRKQILQHGDTLLTLFRLEQPNNHDVAYSILKKLSGIDFGATNVAAWEKWVDSAKKEAV